MTSKMEMQKAKLKEKMNEEIDQYFRGYEKASQEETFTINEIERMMMINQRNLKKLMNETNEELVGSVTAADKKMP